MPPLPAEPFTLLIELDAWNIRQRDHWGCSARRRAYPSRWHWVYGGTCFRLDRRVENDSGRARILSRGPSCPGEAWTTLRAHIFAEAQRHGLAQAAKALGVAGGAVWIWNLTGDRFPQAQQRLDCYHASRHLWAVAHAPHPEDEVAARTWITPLLKKLKGGRVTALLNDLRAPAKRLRQKQRQALAAEATYLENHQGRMDYAAARPAGEPQGSGAMESTCRQYQCRSKRPAQF